MMYPDEVGRSIYCLYLHFRSNRSPPFQNAANLVPHDCAGGVLFSDVAAAIGVVAVHEFGGRIDDDGVRSEFLFDFLKFMRLILWCAKCENDSSGTEAGVVLRDASAFQVVSDVRNYCGMCRFEYGRS